MLEHLRLLSRYNQWMNDKLYNTAAQLPADELARDRGAFFGSLQGTLSHIMVADIIWLQRFSEHPTQHPALDQIRAMPKPQTLPDDFTALSAERRNVDATIISWCEQLDASDLNHKLTYHNMKGEPAIKNLASLMLHFFNHQTHHRGQATTLLSQQGLDIGVTDLLALVASE
ncbi:putative damage-inducible protein DinB [Methylobacter tundripaludum]|uniref:Putative damage-inducible protein DinB n=1 Tax=Methylobacter tundripaludum TaxID=173365 RepID=A0A2S6HCH8_9GAMM|nr:DinB family protein [Methylobacter tundripaludum]PPK75204.1 putative damage-inducible protein DinB [Methylobacter tundripaludum]